MATVNASVSCGIGIEKPFGRRGDLFGLGFNWMRPSSAISSAGNGGGLLGGTSTAVEFVGLPYNQTNVFASPGTTARPQSMIEAFYRVQLTESMQLTPDIQVVFDPSARDDTDVSVVLGLRLTTDF